METFNEFRFQLTKEEYLQILKSKILTSKSGVNTQLSDNYETNEFLRSKNLTIELSANGSVSTENTNETNLKSKFLTSSWGGNRKLPYVFTEQGVYMLMTVYHDRYIVVDYGRKVEKIYHCGASSKDAGNKVTTITEVTDRQVYHPIVDALLLNPVLLLI